MERVSRTAFQGVVNIVRFNWHYYAVSLALITSLLIANHFLSGTPCAIINLFTILFAWSILVSLMVSFFIYDYSDLYKLNWLDSRINGPNDHILNINAGFDETSRIVKDKFPKATLTVLDFYDPAKHTEISIERARKAYPKYPGTMAISTLNIGLPANSANIILLIFAAHEIRNTPERTAFFKQLRQVLIPGGEIIVVEHVRDWYNFLAYTIGYFHFYPKAVWKQTFSSAGFAKSEQSKINPFVSIFYLKKDGSTT
jgi:ubiquinone/menaquinone biosynthesis C-methylase UbiE